MTKLSQLPNIGPILEQRLAAVEIIHPDQLRKIGSKEAFLLLQLKDPDV